jgi:hypothetical protein
MGAPHNDVGPGMAARPVTADPPQRREPYLVAVALPALGMGKPPCRLA